jgi:23S rRNA (adenine2503-C2)-methyltransferase
MMFDELAVWVKAVGQPAFRAKQIYQWMHEKLAEGFDEMTNLSKDLREKLAQEFTIERAKSCDRLDSSDGKTTKFLLN